LWSLSGWPLECGTCVSRIQVCITTYTYEGVCKIYYWQDYVPKRTTDSPPTTT
jgi:hypothetical protein